MCDIQSCRKYNPLETQDCSTYLISWRRLSALNRSRMSLIFSQHLLMNSIHQAELDRLWSGHAWRILWTLYHFCWDVLFRSGVEGHHTFLLSLPLTWFYQNLLPWSSASSLFLLNSILLPPNIFPLSQKQIIFWRYLEIIFGDYWKSDLFLLNPHFRRNKERKKKFSSQFLHFYNVMDFFW